MFIKCVQLLVFSCLSYLAFSTNGLTIHIQRKFDKLDRLHDALATMLQCNMGLKNVIVFDSDNDSSIMEIVSVIQPPIALTLKSEIKDDTEFKPFNFRENQGFIFALNLKAEWSTVHRNINFYWPCVRNCTIILLVKPPAQCSGSLPILRFLSEMYVPNVYYVCINPENYLIILTHDLFGNAQPIGWHWFGEAEAMIYNMSVYTRYFDKNDVCRGLTFARTDPLHNRRVYVGFVERGSLRNARFFLSDNLSDRAIGPIHKENIENLKRILNMEFFYQIVVLPYAWQDKGVANGLITRGNVALVMNEVVILESQLITEYFYPVTYSSYTILSHNQGLATPLEKIAKFYGIWTLISLIVISIIVFIVIWVKTNRNTSSATFDVLRLLINSGVFVPLDTLSIKVFFTMIFLYFTVIHATFSGNLPKFLTIPTFRDNIDTIEDLANPRIKVIHSFHYIFDENTDNIEIIKNKTQLAGTIVQCFGMTLENPESACIGTRGGMVSRRAQHDVTNKLYLSKKTFFPVGGAAYYRKRMPFREQFNWAFMALTETRIHNYVQTVALKNFTIDILKREMKSEIDYRPICMDDLMFAFILLGIGLSLAIFCFITEIIVSRRNTIRMKIRKVKETLGHTKKVKVRKINIQPN